MISTVFGSQWTAVAGIWVAALSFLGLLIRQIGPWKKQAAEAEARLRDALIKRVEKLERRLERQQAAHTAEQAINHHQLRNVTACFDAMLLLVEMNPDRGPEIVAKIKEMRAAQMIAEAQEKAIFRASQFVADAPVEETEDMEP